MNKELSEYHYYGMLSELGIMVIPCGEEIVVGVKMPLTIKPKPPVKPTYKEKQRLKTFLPKFATCKAIVGKILKENPKTRGSDRQLIIEVARFCKRHDMHVPAYETITRTRRKYNEAGLYMPSPRTVARRKNREKTFRYSAKEGLL